MFVFIFFFSSNNKIKIRPLPGLVDVVDVVTLTPSHGASWLDGDAGCPRIFPVYLVFVCSVPAHGTGALEETES